MKNFKKLLCLSLLIAVVSVVWAAPRAVNEVSKTSSHLYVIEKAPAPVFDLVAPADLMVTEVDRSEISAALAKTLEVPKQKILHLRNTRSMNEGAYLFRRYDHWKAAPLYRPPLK